MDGACAAYGCSAVILVGGVSSRTRTTLKERKRGRECVNEEESAEYVTVHGGEKARAFVEMLVEFHM